MDNQLQKCGFLVVLAKLDAADDASYIRNNPNYLGVGRMPACTSEIPEEEDALWNYMMDNTISDSTNLISSYDIATAVKSSLNCSPRQFEIIACGPNERTVVEFLGDLATRTTFLGYDVATIHGGYWSIVGDFPSHGTQLLDHQLQSFKGKLNSYGLFSNDEDASSYLSMYRKGQFDDWDDGLIVVFVCSVRDV